MVVSAEMRSEEMERDKGSGVAYDDEIEVHGSRLVLEREADGNSTSAYRC